jgi:hypothetical protein
VIQADIQSAGGWSIAEKPAIPGSAFRGHSWPPAVGGQDDWNQQGQQSLRQGFTEWESATAPGFFMQRLSDSAMHKRFLHNLV